MTSQDGQGLGVSIAIYMVAVVCGLALFVLPVLFASGPTKIVNAGMAAYAAPPGTRLIPLPARYSTPLAALERDDPVDPAPVAEVSAKIKKAEKPQHLASRPEQRVRSTVTPAEMRYAQPANNGRFFFRFF